MKQKKRLIISKVEIVQDKKYKNHVTLYVKIGNEDYLIGFWEHGDEFHITIPGTHLAAGAIYLAKKGIYEGTEGELP